MRKIKLLFVTLLSMMAWNGVMAQTDAEYNDALAAMTDGGNYRITTEVGGTKYYVTTAGNLTSTKADGGVFAITKKTGGEFKTTGFRIYGAAVFTNPPLNGNVANLTPGSFSTSTGNDRDNWERQVLFLNSDGKYAIRSCNTTYATSSWGDAGRTYWTYAINPVTPQYSYDPAYVWNFEELLASVNVTYEVYDGTTKVTSATVVQDANSEVVIPTTLTGAAPYGSYEPYALYNYTVEEGATIGDADCTIKVNRTFAPGLAHALTDLSNVKAYTIRCDRGALLTKDGFIASTSHATLHDAEPAKFAVLSYEDNYYLYSVADKKFVKNNGELSAMLGNGVNDAIIMTPQTDPYFLYTFKIDNSTTYGLNTNGTGALNGCVINSWTSPDQGDQYYMIEAADFDPTDAIAALEAYFHPSYYVTYVVKDGKGNTLFTSEPQPTTLGATITALPSEFQKVFTKYNEVNVTISNTSTTVEFTATWDGPFELSSSIDDAKWYNMTIRSDYWVAMDETEPYYPKSDKDRMADASQWAFTGNAYAGISVFNKAKGAGWTLTKDGSNVVMREGAYTWTIGKNSDGFTLLETGTANNVVNQNGGSTGPLQFWNSGGAFGDNGSTFRIFDVPVKIYFDVTYNGDVVATAQDYGYVGKVPELPASLQRDFVTFSEITNAVTAADEHIAVTATWNADAPFELAAKYADAHWYNMAVRGNWYVTSDNKNDEGALKTIEANAIGLKKDAYQWAFVGDPWHVQIFNKAEGADKVYTWVDASNAVPEFLDATTENYWSIVKGTKIDKSFMITIPGTQYRQVNQNGGAGGPLKLWTANTTADEGSAFTVFDVPTNFAAFTEAIEAVMTSDVTGYFTLNAETKALWKDEYKTNCSYENYVAMQEAIDNDDNWIWPTTGYYRVKSVNYPGYYMSYEENEGQPMACAVENPAEAAANIVKLTDLGGHKYTVTIGGLSATQPTQSNQIELAKEGATFKAVKADIGVVAFTTETEGNDYGAIHCNGSYNCVGWVVNAAASQWTLEDATVNSIDASISNVGYATLNALWPVTIPTGVKAYVGKILNNKYLVMTEVTGTIPAATPVVIEGEEGTYTFNFADDVEAVENDLKGTYAPLEYTEDTPLYYVLNVLPTNAEIGFYALNGTLAANRAYLEIQGGAATVKGITLSWGNPTGIETVKTAQAGKTIYNLAGQRVLNAQKGIYIVDGKKAVVK